ncbi:hypothetical protein AXW83_18275 [Bosea sp. PAMC 26642]|nr:hypothetical protein AXW83_18275 [Bosea sp. PAMC 26642]
MEGTTSVSYSPTFSNGKIIGCGIEFNAVVRDWAFRKGEYDKVSGSFGIMTANQNIAPVLKVVVHELDRGDFSLKPVPPKKAYVISGNRSNFDKLVSSYNSDTPGALFSVFQLEPTVKMYADALGSGTLSIRYGKSASGIDAPLRIDLRVVETQDSGNRVRSDKPIEEMFGCISDLFKSVR